MDFGATFAEQGKEIGEIPLLYIIIIKGEKI